MKRVCSLLLSLALLLSVAQPTALATEVAASDETTAVAATQSEESSSEEEAAAASEDEQAAEAEQETAEVEAEAEAVQEESSSAEDEAAVSAASDDTESSTSEVHFTTLKIAGVDILSAENYTITYDDGGTVVFDPETDTLTLTNANIPNNGTYGITSTGAALTIELVGENTITTKLASGIVVNAADLTIIGSGNLTVNAYGSGIGNSGTGKTVTLKGTGEISVTSTSSIGIAGSNIVIENQKNLTINSKSYGIDAKMGGDGLFIVDSTVTVTASGTTSYGTKYYGIHSYTSISISGDSDVTVSSGVGAISATDTVSVTPGTSGSTEVLVGTSEDDAVQLEGSPYSATTELTLSDDYAYVHIQPYTESSDSALTVVIPEDLSDGTYTGSATVCHDEDEAFSDYPITVEVTVSNGALSSFSVSGASGHNAQYSTRAETGLNTQLADKTVGSYEVDVVTNATCSSKGIVEAVNAALQSEPSTTSIALGNAIYDAEGTAFTVTVTNPVNGIDYSDITLAYSVGKFSNDLDESAYSVALTSQSESELIYTVTIVAGSGTDIEDDEMTHSVSYNNVGMALNVTVAGTTVGQVTIESSAVYAIENNVLTVTGGNGETLADFIDAASELAISYVDESTGETVSQTYTLQWQHDIEPEYTGSDIFNEDGSINFNCAVFAYGETGAYTLTITATGYNEVTATVGGAVGGYVYAYMNVPYSAFYAGLNDSGDVDTVTSATTSKAANCKNVYLTVDSEAGTTSIYGVVVPVKMSAATYEAVAGLVTDSAAAYYVGEAVEDPAVYLELTYADGTYTFSDIQGTTTTTEISDTTISSTSVWGDYEVDLDSDNGIATADVYGVYVTTAEGNQYAMKQSENLWTPSNYYEFAWDTIDNAYYSGMEGETIESITFLTTSGIVVYTLDEPLYVQEHMSSVPTAEFTSATTLVISNLADDAADVSVTVKASGRNGASLTDEAKSLVDGVVTLDTAATDGVTYRVTISSDNYASNLVNVVYTEVFAIVTDPVDVSAVKNSSATFTVEATGSDLTYQWQYQTASGSRWYNCTATTGEGYASDSVTLTATKGRNGYKYRCVVTNGDGETLTSEQAVLTVTTPVAADAITITAQPEDVTAAKGDSVTLTVAATSNLDEALTYQWQYKTATGSKWYNCTATTGEGYASDSVTLTATKGRNGYSYCCKITDASGNVVYTDVITLTVTTE